MSTSGMTFGEMTESLTGFDEIAIEKHMGMDPYADAERKPVGLMRALVFAHVRRSGVADPEAKQKVLGMSLKDVNNYFEVDGEDVDPDEPDTESGKDDSPAA